MKNKIPTHNEIARFIEKQQFSPESEWPSLILCLHSHQFNEHLSGSQRADFSTLLAEILNSKSFSNELLQELFLKKEAILNANYVAELQDALEETANLLDQFKTISNRRVGDIIDLEKVALRTVNSGSDPSTMVTELSRAFKAVIKVMKEDNIKLEELSNTDHLSGLANRRYFDTFLDQAIAAVTAKDSFALLMIDIDNFKNFNDDFGHLIGDEILKIVSKIIRESVCECNNKIHKKYLSARYGGEEFAIIMQQSTEKQCLHLAEFIRERIAHYPIVIRDTNREIIKKDIHITVSAGFCLMHPLWIEENNPADKVIEAADKALLTAKKRGKNMVCQCKPYLNHNNKMILTVL